MASRQEEKERRRTERMAAEQQARAAATRARRLQIAGGAILVLAVVVVAAIVASGSGGSSSNPGATKSQLASVAIPKPGPNATNLAAAAKAAGCVAKTYPMEGRTHTTSSVTYHTNPPTSGNHNPTPASDGVYSPGNEPATENYVHTLEHGRIEIQYRPGTPKGVRDQLETLFNEPNKGTAGYHELLFENNTSMPYAVAATAWTHLLGCPQMNDRVFDAIRAFRAAYTDKGPEFIP